MSNPLDSKRSREVYVLAGSQAEADFHVSKLPREWARYKIFQYVRRPQDLPDVQRLTFLITAGFLERGNRRELALVLRERILDRGARPLDYSSSNLAVWTIAAERRDR